MIKRIGVIGAGQMGSGIAHVCALKGFDIRLADVDQSHLDKGLENISRNMDRQIGRGMIRPEDKDAALRRISTSTDYKQFADCDLIVEAATENEQVKREIFKKVCVDLPANVSVGTYQAEVYLFRDGQVTSAQSSPLFVNKTGIEQDMFELSRRRPALYGLLAIVLSLAAGWIANFVMRRG